MPTETRTEPCPVCHGHPQSIPEPPGICLECGMTGYMYPSQLRAYEGAQKTIVAPPSFYALLDKFNGGLNRLAKDVTSD